MIAAFRAKKAPSARFQTHSPPAARGQRRGGHRWALGTALASRARRSGRRTTARGATGFFSRTGGAAAAAAAFSAELESNSGAAAVAALSGPGRSLRGARGVGHGWRLASRGYLRRRAVAVGRGSWPACSACWRVSRALHARLFLPIGN